MLARMLQSLAFLILKTKFVYEREMVHFLTCLLYHKSFGPETWPTNRYSHGQYFLEITLNDWEDWVLVPGAL